MKQPWEKKMTVAFANIVMVIIENQILKQSCTEPYAGHQRIFLVCGEMRRTTDTFLCPESQTLIYCQPLFTDTGYLHTVYFHFHNYVIIVDIVRCSNNDRFLRVNKILLQYLKKTVTK